MKQYALKWYAIFEGCLLIALCVRFLGAAELLIGGTAGLSLVVNQWLPASFGAWFFCINLPFFILSLKQMGRAFTLKTLICIALVSVLSDVLKLIVHFEHLPEWFAAFVGGSLIGAGLVMLFRNNASLGGINVLALYFENRFGVSSGKVVLALDLIVFSFGLMIFPLEKALISLLGFVAITSILERYHKKKAPKIKTVPSSQTVVTSS